jgi:site-specific recombinase XerD
VDLGEAVEAFAAGYFSTCRRSGKTQAAYRIDLAQMQSHLGPLTPLASLRSESLEKWAMELRAKGYASVSIRRKFATARVFFSYWVRKEVLDASPLWRIRLDLGRERTLPRSLTPSDAKRLIEEPWRRLTNATEATPSPNNASFRRLRDVAALEVLFATGIRVGELVSLRLGDWCEEDRALIVRGKGARQRLAFLPDDRSLKALCDYVTQRRKLLVEHDSLLVNAAGNAISPQGIARILAIMAKQAGIATKVTPHMIRHTVATLLLRYGADIRIVQEVLGHASIATTQRYTHVSKEHLLSALQTRHPSHHLDIKWPA